MPLLCELKTSKMFFGEDSSFGCSYYIALPAGPRMMMLDDLLTVKRAVPMLKLLLRNEKSDDMKILLQNCIAGRGDYIGLPMMSSPITAMTMGFFAYKPEGPRELSKEPKQSQQSQPLHLVHIRTKSLLNLMPPNSNPLCPFWLFKPAGLMSRFHKNELTVKVQEFRMKVNMNAEYQPQADLIKHSDKARMLNLKRKLEDEVEELQAEMKEKRVQIQKISNLWEADTATEEKEPLPEPSMIDTAA